MKRYVSVIAAALALALLGCWDKVEHVYDCNDDTGCDTDADTDTDSDTDSDPVGDGGMGRRNLPDGWEGFGEACQTDEDCQGYPGERRCLFDVLGLINVPGGYCSSCCDAEEIDGCAEGIDCVGANGVYTVCIAHCESDDDCRQSDGYECREIYYIPDVFPGTYCLPNESVMQPDTDQPPQDLDCPWPWNE